MFCYSDDVGSLGSMVNIHKQFGGTGLGSMLSLDGIDCNNVYAGEAEEAADKPYDSSTDSLRERGEERDRERGGDRDREMGVGERASQDGRTHTNTPPQSIGFSLDGRLSGVTSAAALRVSEIERASAPIPVDLALTIKSEPDSDGNSRIDIQNPTGLVPGHSPDSAAVSNNSATSMLPQPLEVNLDLPVQSDHTNDQNNALLTGLKSENNFAMNTASGHPYAKQMSISSHSAALIPSSSAYGNSLNSQYNNNNNVVPIPLSQVMYLSCRMVVQEEKRS